MPEDEAIGMPVFVEKWYVLILGSLYTLCVITAAAAAQQGLKAFGGSLKSCKSNIYIPLVSHACLQLIHILALSLQVMVYYGSVDYIVSPFPDPRCE